METTPENSMLGLVRGLLKFVAIIVLAIAVFALLPESISATVETIYVIAALAVTLYIIL